MSDPRDLIEGINRLIAQLAGARASLRMWAETGAIGEIERSGHEMEDAVRAAKAIHTNVQLALAHEVDLYVSRDSPVPSTAGRGGSG